MAFPVHVIQCSDAVKFEIGVFFEDIEANLKKIECMPYIFHEITHAVQYICEELGMDMELEKEGVAYMVSYLIESILTSMK